MDKFTQVYAKYVDAVSRKLNRKIVKEQVEGYWKLDLPFDPAGFLYNEPMVETYERLDAFKELDSLYRMTLSDNGPKINVGDGLTLTAYVPKGKLRDFLSFGLYVSSIAEIYGVDDKLDEASSEEELASLISEPSYSISVSEVAEVPDSVNGIYDRVKKEFYDIAVTDEQFPKDLLFLFKE